VSTQEAGIAATLERARAALSGIEHRELEARDGVVLGLDRGDLHAALLALRDRAGFESLTFVTAVDRYPAEPRFEVSHQLLSITHADRIRLRTRVGEEDASVPTATDLFPGASFMERECFDMFGIRFDGHPDLRRLLMPEGYGHHPLRKDFPHQGIEPDRLYREWDRARREGWNPS